MPPRLELAGRQFGELTVLGRSHQDAHQAWVWSCQCSCGARVSVRGSTLAAGRTSACASCASKKSSTTHGATGTPLYLRWRAMLDRCERPENRAWRNYGGRGISVCARWHAFEQFAADMADGFDPALELDRINPDGNYEPGNCRWATRVEQQNNRRNNHRVEFRGQTRTVHEWAVSLGLKPNTLIYRLRRGWPVERALTQGVDPDVLLAIANEAVTDGQA